VLGKHKTRSQIYREVCKNQRGLVWEPKREAEDFQSLLHPSSMDHQTPSSHRLYYFCCLFVASTILVPTLWEFTCIHHSFFQSVTLIARYSRQKNAYPLPCPTSADDYVLFPRTYMSGKGELRLQKDLGFLMNWPEVKGVVWIVQVSPMKPPGFLEVERKAR
jgi:hypothetical protein